MKLPLNRPWLEEDRRVRATAVHDSDHDDDDRGEDRPQVEDGQDHDHEPGQDGQAEELLQQVLDRPDPLADLVGSSSTPTGDGRPAH